jgi:hypothetical protein
VPAQRTDVRDVEYGAEAKVALDAEAHVIGCLQGDGVLGSQSIVCGSQSKVSGGAEGADGGIKHLAINE